MKDAEADSPQGANAGFPDGAGATLTLGLQALIGDPPRTLSANLGGTMVGRSYQVFSKHGGPPCKE